MTIISKSPSALGVAAFLGIKSKRVPGFKQGIKEAASMIKDGDVFLHVEETDDISHKRAPREKVELLEAVDKEAMRNAKLPPTAASRSSWTTDAPRSPASTS